MYLLFDDFGYLTHFSHHQVGTASDVEQHPRRAIDTDFKQWRIENRRNRCIRSVDSVSLTDSHPSRASITHHRPQICEIQVDLTWKKEQLGNRLDTLAQNFVSHPERHIDRCVRCGYQKQSLVRNHDHGVNFFGETVQALCCLLVTLIAFEGKRLCHHSNSQASQFAFGNVSNDRRPTGARATTHASGYKYQIGTPQYLAYLFAAIEEALASDLWVTTDTTPPCYTVADA